MNKQPDLTVVTICLNARTKLEKTINSVLAQKRRSEFSIEHILIDGASTDRSVEYLRDQKQRGNIEHLVSEQDKGIYDAMNKGLSLAKGKAIAFLNAGDTYKDSDVLKRCVTPLFNGFNHVAANASLVEENSETEVGEKQASTKLLYLFNGCCHQAYFARTEDIKRLGGFDETFRCFADTDLMFAMNDEHGDPYKVNDKVVNYELGGFSEYALDSYWTEPILMKWKHIHAIIRVAKKNEEYREAVGYSLLLDITKLCRKYTSKQWLALATMERMVKWLKEELTFPPRIYYAINIAHEFVLPNLKSNQRAALRYMSACKALVNVQNPAIAIKPNDTMKDIFES